MSFALVNAAARLMCGMQGRRQRPLRMSNTARLPKATGKRPGTRIFRECNGIAARRQSEWELVLATAGWRPELDRCPRRCALALPEGPGLVVALGFLRSRWPAPAGRDYRRLPTLEHFRFDLLADLRFGRCQVVARL
jgi:hypothetical protein